MTDDFQLFADPDDGDGPIDPDLALVSAYLARELSPLQVLAFEERLATDAAFRASVQPLFDLWAAPVASLEGGAARRVPPLSAAEQADSWQRFLEEAPAADASRHDSRRRISMKRIAAVIAVTVLPMVSFAQVVLHAANNADVPGHTIARRIVAPFVDEARPATAAAPAPGRPAPKTQTRPAAQPATTAADGATNAGVGEESLTAAQRAEPNRARIAELAKQHQGAVVRGDTAAEYIVMVLDAADRHVWSTSGSGIISIEVAGDTRTPIERAEYNRRYRSEFGSAAAGGRGGGAGRLTAFGIRHDSATVRFFDRADSAGARDGGGVRIRLHGTDSTDRSSAIVRRGYLVGVDSALRARADTLGYRGRLTPRVRAGGTGDSAWVVYSFQLPERRPGDSTSLRSSLGYSRAVGGGGRGGGGADSASGAAGAGSAYVTAWSGSRALVNQASGLSERGGGQSGIQGLPSASVSSADAYFFAAGELASQALKIIVVHLVPGTTWPGR